MFETGTYITSKPRRLPRALFTGSLGIAFSGVLVFNVAAPRGVAQEQLTRNAYVTYAIYGTYTTDMSFSPHYIYRFGSATGILTTAVPAPAGGVTYKLSLPAGSLNSVPVTVKLEAGKKTATFLFRNLGEKSLGDETILVGAVGNNGDKTLGAIPVYAPRNVASLSFGGLTGTPGEPLLGRVSFALPAPPTGLVIGLKSSSLDFVVPPTVYVPAGLTSATFLAMVSSHARAQMVTVTAGNVRAGGGASRTISVFIAEPAFASMSFRHSEVLTGFPNPGLLALTGPAPSGGLTFKLNRKSGTPVATASAVTIPEGKSSVGFDTVALAPPGGKPAVATVLATSNGVSHAASYLVLPKVLSAFPTPFGNPIDTRPILIAHDLAGKITNSLSIGVAPYGDAGTVVSGASRVIVGSAGVDGATLAGYWRSSTTFTAKVIGMDGRLYTPVYDAGEYFPRIACIDADTGHVNWKFDTRAVYQALPLTFGEDGSVFGVGFSDMPTWKSFAVNADGTKRADGSDIPGFFPLGQTSPDNLIGLTWKTGGFTSLDAYGPGNRKLWSYPEPSSVRLAHNKTTHTLYVSDSFGLTAYTDAGIKKWNRLSWGNATTSDLSAGPSIALGQNGTIYRDGANSIEAYSPTGDVLWIFHKTVPGGYVPIFVMSFLGKDGKYHDNVLAKTDVDIPLTCIDGDNGNLKWNLSAPSETTEFVPGGDGSIYAHLGVQIPLSPNSQYTLYVIK